MKKAALILLTILAFAGCSENYSKKKDPPSPPAAARDAKPQEKEAAGQPKEAGKDDGQNDGAKVE